MIYGKLPEDLGFVSLSPVEMMCWMYLPISTPSEPLTLPPNLEQFGPIIANVAEREWSRFKSEYVYLTAKTLWVSGDYIGNRPGWHSDGFGTDDLNFIWYDRAPTEFIEGSFTLPDGCDDAMMLMADMAKHCATVTYPDKHLLRLTPAVVHRSPVAFAPGMRTFVKVSISPDRYNLEGNSINHGLHERWPLLPRALERNHPAKTPAAMSPSDTGSGDEQRSEPNLGGKT